ncbi:MAG: PAS domain S-box protein [Deltaproteobacteria bacterium]
MVTYPEKNRIQAMIGSLRKFLAGDTSVVLGLSSKKDDLDSLAATINKLLKKTSPSRLFPAAEKTAPPTSTQSEERFRSLLDRMQESYFELDIKGNFIFFNDRVGRKLGYTRDEISGMNFRKLLDRENKDKLYEIGRNILLTGKAVENFEWQLIKKSGQKMDVESSIALIRDQQGQPAGFYGVVRDITLRKKAERELRFSEERYRHILESIEESYFEVDLHGNLLFFNDAMVRNLNYTPDEIHHMNFRKLVDDPDAKKIIEVFHQVYLTGETVKGFDWKINAKDGGKMDVESSVALLKDESGQPRGFRGMVRDISQRKQTERRLRMIANNIRDVIWTMDFEGRFTYASPSVTTVFGYTPEELPRLSFTDYLTPDSRTRVRLAFSEELARIAAGHREVSDASKRLELEVIRKDGETRWVEVQSDFNHTEDGAPFEVLGVARDITERRKAEEAFRTSEHLYRLIVENVHDVVFVVDFNFRFTFISNHRALLTGYTPEEIRKIPVERLLPPQSIELATRIFAEAMEQQTHPQTAREGNSRTIELEVYHKNGGTVWLEITATFGRDAEGKAREIVAAARDITARKKIELALEESEERYRMIVENMNESIVVLDLDLNYLYQSPSEIRITGYTPEEIMKIPSEKQVTPESYARGVAMLAEELEKEFSGQPVDPDRSRTIELESYHKNGGTVWLEMTASFTRDKSGKPTGILMAGRNISERKKAEAEKERLEKQLVQSQKMETVGRLAGGVAHDFNNMLNVILGYVDLTKLKLSNDHPILQDILEIERAACRSRDLTQQLLAFSRKQIIRPRAVNLNRLIAETEKAVLRLISEDIDLTFYPGDNLWTIKFDPLQAEQILINLAVNARDAMPQGGKLNIETSNIAIDETYCASHLDLTPGPYVLLTVSDTGSGISKDLLPYIFEPFFTTKDVGKGTGLGLATVYGIVRQNDGTINVYSEPGKGSTFKIYLPRSTDADVIEENSPKPVAAPGSGTILLVEDDKMVLKLVADMLGALGYEVISSENPLEALSQCEKEKTPIDLVITDVVMPVMSGRELRDRLLTTRPNVKVLFMSGYPSNIIAQHGVLEEGMDFIQKPFGMADMAAKVSELILRIKADP